MQTYLMAVSKRFQRVVLLLILGATAAVAPHLSWRYRSAAADSERDRTSPRPARRTADVGRGATPPNQRNGSSRASKAERCRLGRSARRCVVASGTRNGRRPVAEPGRGRPDVRAERLAGPVPRRSAIARDGSSLSTQVSRGARSRAPDPRYASRRCVELRRHRRRLKRAW